MSCVFSHGLESTLLTGFSLVQISCVKTVRLAVGVPAMISWLRSSLKLGAGSSWGFHTVSRCFTLFHTVSRCFTGFHFDFPTVNFTAVHWTWAKSTEATHPRNLVPCVPMHASTPLRRAQGMAGDRICWTCTELTGFLHLVLHLVLMLFSSLL